MQKMRKRAEVFNIYIHRFDTSFCSFDEDARKQGGGRMSTLTRVIVADDADAQTSKKLPAEFLLNPKRITEIFYTWGFFALYRYSSNIAPVDGFLTFHF